MALKTCKKCGGVDFYSDSKCKACKKAYALARYYADPRGSQDRARAWKKANVDRARQLGRKGGRKDWLPGEHDRAEAARATTVACGVCGSGDARHKRGWNADHDHASGRFRGIVCHPCNIAIAHVEKYGLDRGVQIQSYLAKGQA